jgi:methylmalonyl-CoA/ethylmalonyl-CoA epimerase
VFIMIIDHVGIVVKSLEKGIEDWQTIFGYQQMTEMVVNTRQKVKVVFMSKNNSLPVKLLEPTDESSPVFALARKGGGLHHLCFKCDDMGTELIRFKEQNLRILADPQPGEAFENENIAFLYAKQGLNVELIDTDKRAKRID